MSATTLNWLVVIAYFAVTVGLGAWLGRGQRSLDDYFLAGRRMPWWTTSLSIVGTETSTLTFVGVPAIAYAGDLTFLQVALGYVVGRFFVAWLLVPAYFAGRVQTAYELLARRFGPRVQTLSSTIFLLSRCLSDGVRLFATALVLQVLLPLPLSATILLVTGVTLLYTWRGGLRAVIWNDSVQLLVYMGGAALSLVLLVRLVPGGWPGAVDVLTPLGKLAVFDFVWDWTRPYMFWSGLVGGAVLTTATHGTDQMFVHAGRALRPATGHFPIWRHICWHSPWTWHWFPVHWYRPRFCGCDAAPFDRRRYGGRRSAPETPVERSW